MRYSVLLLLAFFQIGGCASKLSYSEAKVMADRHKDIFNRAVEEQTPWAKCMSLAYTRKGSECGHMEQAINERDSILFFSSNGVVKKAYTTETTSDYGRCISKAFIGVACANAPLSSMYFEIDVHATIYQYPAVGNSYKSKISGPNGSGY